MVRLRVDVLDAALASRRWNDNRLASEAGLSYQSIYNLRRQRNAGAKAQWGIYRALGCTVPITDLFEIVEDEDESDGTEGGAEAEAA
jgi:DNA-binding Xre family transcriptional regulator